MSDPKILIMDDPTRGVDVGAKFEIYKLMNELAEQGVSIIMISSELEEVLGMSDRVMVMHEGRSSGIIRYCRGDTRKNNGFSYGHRLAAKLSNDIIARRFSMKGSSNLASAFRRNIQTYAIIIALDSYLDIFRAF